MRWPLARQILLPMVGILLLTVGLASALAAWLASRQVQMRIETQLSDIAQTLSASNFPLESTVLRQARGLTGMELVLVDARGNAIAASDDRLIEFAHRPVATTGKMDFSRSVGSGAGTYFHAAIHIDRRPVGGSRQLLHVFYPQDAWQAARWQATWPPLATGAAAMILVAIAAYAIALRVTRPIQQLKAQVARIAGGDFSPVAAPARDDEVRDLALAVNKTAGKLADFEARSREQERLSTLGTLGGGIAHQIRNAATGCRLALDLHQRDLLERGCGAGFQPADGNGRQDASPTRDEPLAVAARQLELIESHIQRFLTLGRPAPAPREAVELSAVIRAAISLVEPAALHLGAPIEWESSNEPLTVMADRESLAQMIVNLLMNAVQATAQALAPVGGPAADGSTAVVVRVERSSPSRVALEIGDPGPGPSPAIQDRLFEPFATDKPGGTGLGLVVARRIAEDHGGSIRWTRKGERTWFIVELPVHGNGAN